MVVYDYVGENYDPVEYHIKNFLVTGNDLPPLLTELESVQSPEHWKYQTEEGHYYDCCSNIETLVTDEYHEAPYWIRTNVAHNGEDYYLVGYKGLSMDGLRIRVRSAA